MTKETMYASTVATHAALDAVIKKYKLPKTAVLKLFGDVFSKRMKEIGDEMGKLIREGKL